MEPFEIKAIAEPHLRKIFALTPGIQKYLLDDWKFKRWTELCSQRVKQIILFTLHTDQEKKVNRDNLSAFIKNAANEYARVQLERAGHKVAETPPNQPA